MQDRFTHQSTGLAVDPITLEVIRHALVAIANQIDANIKRTAFSPYIYEYNDFAVGLTDPDGQLVAQCTGGMPPFVADSVGMAVRDGLEIYGRERLCGGDVVVCNHAAVQGQHLNNTVLAASTAGAETVEEFYRGKTITMVVGTGVGGGAVSAYPMALGPVIKKYIPGHPNLVVSYMPGAGGIKAASYIYGIAPQDGTAWGFITRGFLLAPLLRIAQAQFDPTRFNWIGSPTRTVSMGLVWNASTEVRTIEEAMRREVVVGATSIAQDTGIFPRALNRIAGTRFKIVTGYAGLGAVDLALERGEVQGKVGSTWKSLNSGPSARWVTDKTVTVLVQPGVRKAPDIPVDVPLGLDLAKTQQERQILELLCAPSATGYPSFMGPGVPRERVEAIRSAYLQSLKDPEFIEAVQRQGLDLDPIEAGELAEVVRGIYALPQGAVEGARELLPAL